jgi:hypothetical protein
MNLEELRSNIQHNILSDVWDKTWYNIKVNLWIIFLRDVSDDLRDNINGNTQFKVRKTIEQNVSIRVDNGFDDVFSHFHTNK